MSVAAAETRLLIGGEQVAGDGAPLEVENPYTEETIATVATPTDEQVDAAVASADEAAPRWARTPAIERAELLHEVAERLRARKDELAETMTREGGKPLVENADEVGWTAAAFDYYAEMGRNFAGRVIPSIEATQLSLVLKEPLGVAACIVPWNYPLLLLAWKVAPALAAGNSVVCKPSELTPLSTLALAPCFDHLPPGVVNVVAGAGEVGEAVVRDERVDVVAFTGSVETGKRIARLAADRIARINLELGGKDPFIVCADVAGRIDVAAKGGAWAAFLNAGQVCTSAERFYVEEPVYDDFVAAFVDYTRSLVLGDPLDADTDIGPLVSADQRARVAAHVDAAVAAGAERYYRAMVGGQAESWNVRDVHMQDTLDRLLARAGGKAVVWEHNTHIGDARATDMAGAGMVNVGQLARERHGLDDVVAVGFGCHAGGVIAARRWGAAMQRLEVPPARAGSLEALLHDALGEDSLLVFPRTDQPAWLGRRIDHRAIGVVYAPEREAWGNYVPTVVGARYDAFVWCESTRPLRPLHLEPEATGEEQTWPWAV